MRIKNRLFPYPILNNNKKLSDFNSESKFELCFNKDVNNKVDNNFVLSGAHIRSNDSYLSNLLERGSIKGILIIECSDSVFREKYEISSEPHDIKIPLDKLSGVIDISAFIYATEDIEEYSSPSFMDDYIGNTFKIEKYCILAADDGFTVKIENQPEDESKKTSIFTITCDYSHDDNIARYTMNERKIVIYLTEKYYRYYNSIKNNDRFLNVSFAIIAIPPLSECIANIQTLLRKNPEFTLEDVCTDYSWFRSVCNAYERETGTTLTDTQFKDDIKPVELSQIVLNSASCNGINDLFDVITGSSTRTEDEDE